MADENTNSSFGFGGSGKMPSFDFSKLTKDFKLPGVDIATIMDREKKNIEALTEANRIAFEGWQALVRRQAEILQESIKAGRRHRARRGCRHQAHGLGGARFRDHAFEYARIGRDGGQIPEGSVWY